MTEFEIAVLDAIQDNLSISATFVGWEYNDVANELEITIKFKDIEISKATCRIQPVERGESDW